jgi:Flp pilus assembly protein TadD
MLKGMMRYTDPRQLIARASQLLSQGRLDETKLEVMTAFAVFGRRCGEALFLLGMIRITQKKLDEASQLMAEATAVLPLDAGIRYGFGSALMLAGYPERAIVEVQEAVRLQPGMVEAWYALGGLQVRLNRFEDAEQSYRRVLTLAPGHGETLMALGGILLELGRVTDAEAILQVALQEDHHPVVGSGIAQNLALAQERQGSCEAALSSVEIAETLNPQRKLHGIRGDILAGLKRFDEALVAYRAQIKATPEDVEVHKKLNDLLYLLGRDQDEEFLTSYDALPDHPDLQTAKAGFLLMSRRYDEAYHNFTRISLRHPENLQATLGAANALDRMDRHVEATAVLNQALKYHPHNPSLYNALATTSLLGNDPQNAALMSQKALDTAPFYQYALANLGTAWRLLGDERGEALNNYEVLVRVFDLEPPPSGFTDMESFNTELVIELEKLHPNAREFLDQSLRGGTQTRGSLFALRNPLIEKLRRRLDEAIRCYISELKGDAAHPMLAQRANNFAYSGSWSSRLNDSGFHVNHIHPKAG